jgi:hypothetical protein
VGIQGNCDVSTNQQCGWPFLYRTSTVSWFVANTAGGETLWHHTGGTTERRGQGGQVVCMLMGFMNSRGQEVTCMCTNHPVDPKMIEVRPETVLHRMTPMEGSLP